jgi:hypothetical protein
VRCTEEALDRSNGGKIFWIYESRYSYDQMNMCTAWSIYLTEEQRSKILKNGMLGCISYLKEDNGCSKKHEN